MIVLSKIYTKHRRCKGETALGNGSPCGQAFHAPASTAYGTVDEVNATAWSWPGSMRSGDMDAQLSGDPE